MGRHEKLHHGISMALRIKAGQEVSNDRAGLLYNTNGIL